MLLSEMYAVFDGAKVINYREFAIIIRDKVIGVLRVFRVLKVLKVNCPYTFSNVSQTFPTLLL